MPKTHSKKQLWIPFIALMVALSCSTPGQIATQPPVDVGFKETQFALGVQETSIALQQTSIAISNQQQTMQADSAATQLAFAQTSAAPVVPPTQQPPPTQEPPPTQQVVVATAEVLPPSAPTANVEDMSARIKAANVLLYEDMAGNLERYRLISKAVNNVGFSGGRVVDVGDRSGDFKTELIGSTDWDLIIAGVEGRSVVQGEFWGYVQNHINNNVAVIIENWNLDQHYTDIAPIFSDCGIAYEKDWDRPNNYDVVNYAIYILQPDHEFFKSVPNPTINLGNPNFLFWVPPRTNDAGDLIRLASSGDAVLLAGTLTYDKYKHGVVASCMDGRLIVQTFSTHDYKEAEVINMWENYIVWTLTNHFNAE